MPEQPNAIPPNRGLSMLTKGLSQPRLVEGRPQTIDQDNRKVTANDFRGKTEWTLARDLDDNELIIDHTLGRLPVGAWVVSGPAPVHIHASPGQRARWTRNQIVVQGTIAAPWLTVAGTIDNVSAVNIDIAEYPPYESAYIFTSFLITTDQATSNGEWTLIARMKRDGSVVTEPPYDQIIVGTLGGGTVGTGGQAVSFLANLFVRPKKGDKFQLQVY